MANDISTPTLTARIEALAREQAAQKAAETERRKAERAAIWARIVDEAPGLAELAKACKAEFEGRLVRCELGGERVI